MAIVAGRLWARKTTAMNAPFDTGATAWMLTSTALVLFMTLPGLALFYAGLVQAKNVLSVMMHCFSIAALASVLWLVVAYSIAFGDSGAMNAWFGGFGKSFLTGVDLDTASGDIPETVFFMFQMTFAIITPALIVGAYVERIKFAAVLAFSGLWLLLIYAPVAHWVWGGGFLAAWGVRDFAGGLVVHATAGVSALVIACALGPRTGFPNELHPPHSPVLTMIGASMLWVGWFGFNAGSALAADGSAGMAMTVTHISAASACLVWGVIEWARFGKPSLVGVATGTVAGLATITPASGFVGPLGGLCIGLVASPVCFWFVGLVKQRFKIDDSLDVFAVHGVGGTLGIVLTAVFATPVLGGVGYADGSGMGSQLATQLTGAGTVILWAAAITYLIVKVTAALVGLRVDDDALVEGLDLSDHGESGYRIIDL